ncbi:MAG: acyl-CoA dehydrogenase family protein, partial [Planctomycetota bacterium]
MINFDLSEEQQGIRELAREFAEKEVAPKAALHDRSGEFPKEICQKAHELGLMNTVVPDEYGGLGLGGIEDCLIHEELAAGCAGIMLPVVANNLACQPLNLAANDAQKKEYFGRLTDEDVMGLQSRAVKKGDSWILNGQKAWITNGGVANWFVVFAVTDPTRGHKGVSAFIVDADLKGVQVDKKEDMMGQRASSTNMIVFEDVEVPAANLLGEEGTGFYTAMKTFDRTRAPIAAGAVGVARCARDHALRYSKERTAFGKPISDLQAIQFLLADMDRDIEAGRLLCWQAAWLADEGRRNTRETAVAKLFAADTAMRITTDAVQIFG